MTQTTTVRRTVEGGLLAPVPISISVEALRPMFDALGLVEEDWLQRVVRVELDAEAQRLTITRHRVRNGTQTLRAHDGKRLCETFEVQVTR